MEVFTGTKAAVGASKLPVSDISQYACDNACLSYTLLQGTFARTVPGFLDLLSHMFTYNPAKRYTARQALSHTYFSADPAPAAPADLPGADESESHSQSSQPSQKPSQGIRIDSQAQDSAGKLLARHLTFDD